MTSEEKLERAKSEIESGDLDIGQRLLNEVLREDSQNVSAWIMAAEFAEDPDQKIQCLNYALRLAPGDARASTLLAEVTTESTEQEAEPPAPPQPEKPEPPSHGNPMVTTGCPSSNWTSRLQWITGGIAVAVIAALGILMIQGFALQQRLNGHFSPEKEDIEQSSTIIEPSPPGEVSNESTAELENQQTWSDTLIQFGAPIENMVPALAGRRLVVKLQNIPGLTVYDTGTKKILRTLPLARDHCMFAAGGNRILVYYPGDNFYETWDATTFEKVHSTYNRLPGEVVQLTMGHRNATRAFVRTRYAKDNYILNVDDLVLVPASTSRDSEAVHRVPHALPKQTYQRADGDFRFLTAWLSPENTPQISVYQPQKSRWTPVLAERTEGYAAMGDDGRIYTEAGGIFDSTLRELGRFADTKLVPALGGGVFLGIGGDGTLSAYRTGGTIPLADLGSLPFEPGESWVGPPHLYDRRVIFAPGLNYVLCVPPSNDAIIQRDVNPAVLLQHADEAFCFIQSTPPTSATTGKLFEYDVKTLTRGGPFRCSLQFGPPGMQVSANGSVRWQVPGRHKRGAHKVVLLLQDDAGATVHHSFEVQIRHPVRPASL